MSTDEYVGPTFAVLKSDEWIFEFGIRLDNGVVVRMSRDVRAPYNRLMRRRLVPVEA